MLNIGNGRLWMPKDYGAILWKTNVIWASFSIDKLCAHPIISIKVEGSGVQARIGQLEDVYYLQNLFTQSTYQFSHENESISEWCTNRWEKT